MASPQRSVRQPVLARETRLHSSGYGIAIPHGRIKHLKETACAFLRLQTPIDFDAPDGQPVDLVFVLLAPAAATDVHLQILGELAAMFSDEDFRASLRAARTPPPCIV